MDRPLPARGVPLWKQARATQFSSVSCVSWLCLIVFQKIGADLGPRITGLCMNVF